MKTFTVSVNKTHHMKTTQVAHGDHMHSVNTFTDAVKQFTLQVNKTHHMKITLIAQL